MALPHSVHVCCIVLLYIFTPSVCNAEDGVLSIETSQNQNRSSENAQSSTNSCAEVIQVYSIKNIGLMYDQPSNNIQDLNLTECPSQTTSCCTQSMLEGYRRAVKNDFWAMLQSSSADLKTLLSTSEAAFRESFLSLIQASQSNTNVLFSDVYKKMDVVSRRPVSKLYADLTSYILAHPVDLEESVKSFFDDLFPLVYHHSINPNLKDFSDDYKECLRQTRQEMRPFGNIARHLKSSVSKSFSAARRILDSLQLALHVVNTTDHVVFSQECSSNLLQLVYCAHCAGFVDAKPCSGYCLNVARGCLAHLAELDQPWIGFVAAMERVSSGLLGTFNIEEVLEVLDTRISESIMFAMENGPELSKRVKYACGNPRRATSSTVDQDDGHQQGSSGVRVVPVRTKTSLSLHTRVHELVQKLLETKGQYANLADILCSDDSWAVRKEGKCWNGQTLGEYTKTIAGVGVAAQKYNPEMKPLDQEDLVVNALGAKLELMSAQLRQSIAPEKPQSDSYMVEGSGSGSWMRTNHIGGNDVDDEDYSDMGSGSGDYGGGTKPSDFNFDSGDVRLHDVNIKIPDSAGGVASCFCTVGLLCVFAMFLHVKHLYCQ